LHVFIRRDTLAFRIYGLTEITEAFNCNYELNPVYRGQLEAQGLRVSGVSEGGSARIIEVPTQPFFLATGYLPQCDSEITHPHPLILAFLKAALEKT
jgi:CTP synthase